MRIVRRRRKIKAFPVTRQQIFRTLATPQHRHQSQCAHPQPDAADSPQPLTPALYPSPHALQLHQCLMEAILNRRNSDHHSSKQDDFPEDKGDAVITNALTAALHERSVAAESPVANAESCSKGDTMSSEMADPGSPPLAPMTPHAPADFKTQALQSPLLVRLPHRSISCAEQCEVMFHRQLHSIPRKLEHPVQVRRRVSDTTAPLEAQARCSQQPDRRPPKILQCAEACTTACMCVHYLPPPRSEQLSSSLPQLVALARSPNISVTSRVRLRQLPLASSVARRSAQDIQRPRLVARSYWVKISAVQVFPRVPQVRADLVAQSPHAQGLVGHSHSIAECADTRKTTCIHVQFPLPQFIMFLLRTFPQSATSARGFRFTNPTQRQYQRAPSQTGVLRRAPCNHSRWSVLPD